MKCSECATVTISMTVLFIYVPERYMEKIIQKLHENYLTSLYLTCVFGSHVCLHTSVFQDQNQGLSVDTINCVLFLHLDLFLVCSLSQQSKHLLSLSEKKF